MFFLQSLNKQFARYLAYGRTLVRRSQGDVVICSPDDMRTEEIILYTFKHGDILYGHTAPIVRDESYKYFPRCRFVWRGVTQMSVFREACAINTMSMSELRHPIFVLGVGVYRYKNIYKIPGLIKIGTKLLQIPRISYDGKLQILYICSFVHNNLKYFDVYQQATYETAPRLGIMKLSDLQELQAHL